MIESGETPYGIRSTPFGKERPRVSPTEEAFETKKRLDFLKKYEPKIRHEYHKLNIDDLVISVVGSVQDGQAGPKSDIDLLIDRENLSDEATIDLYLSTNIMQQRIREDHTKEYDVELWPARQLPADYLLQYWKGQ